MTKNNKFSAAIPSKMTIGLDLGDRYGKKTEEGIRIEMPLSHKELAEMAGTAREVISRVIARFKRMGCVTILDSRLTITDRDKLKSWIF